jgi:hypothetical protein
MSRSTAGVVEDQWQSAVGGLAIVVSNRNVVSANGNRPVCPRTNRQDAPGEPGPATVQKSAIARKEWKMRYFLLSLKVDGIKA